MRRSRVVAIGVIVAVLAAAIAVYATVGGKHTDRTPASSATGATVPVPAGPTGATVLTATDTGPTYAPTFTGNGMLGVRVPATGQGYAATPVPTDSEIAGFYAQPPGGIQVRANLPTWSTLTFADAGVPFSLATGRTSGWRQSIDFRTGVITTTARWTAPGGHVTDLTYEVSTDRARADIGLVRLTLAPEWSGTATVTDAIDGTPATMSRQLTKGWARASRRDWLVVRAAGTKIDAALASDLETSTNVAASTQPVDRAVDQSVGQQLTFPVTDGQQYVFTKYVAVVTTQERHEALGAAQLEANTAMAAGYDALSEENNTAWGALWADRIDVYGDAALASAVNASQFYLWASVREGVAWSVSPAGLSSNGYNGHIFWDAETWMYPALLAQHPAVAATLDQYRDERLGAAQRHATATGFRGARFPWESALDGTEQIPPPDTVFTEGLYEQHITADVGIAQWQYYLATGDQRWLAVRGWPVIDAAAQFWASRAKLGSDGRYHITGVTGPDEENEHVDDEVYTNAAAGVALRDAVSAANVLGLHAPAQWARIAAKLVVPTDSRLGISTEFSGYQGQMIKQADATLLQYPLGYPLAPSVARNNVDYYAPRTDPGGPSMSDAINAIDTAASATPGCASSVYTQRSEEPFIRDVFDQFSETRTGGAFTFVTGIGGFLQEFLYGTTGLRWDADAVVLSPSYSSPVGGVVVRGLFWHGRRFTISVGPRTTTVALDQGDAFPVRVGTATHTVDVGRPLTIRTARPDLVATTDVARCASASATSSQPGAPALAAVDGSPATDWRPVTLPASLTVALPGPAHTVSRATVRWGQQWPAPPAPGPITTRRPASYSVEVSTDGTTWTTVRTVTAGSGTTDTVTFPAVAARAVRIRVTGAAGAQPPMLAELTVER